MNMLRRRDSKMPSFFVFLHHCLRRELLLSLRKRSEWINPIIFFVSIVVFVPLGISPDERLLSQLAPGMVWIIALLAVLLSLDSLFQSDFEDGSLEQILVSGQSLYWVVIIKCIVHWLMTGLPLSLLAPLLGLMMSLPSEGYVPLVISVFLGSGSLSFIGGIGAALTVALRRGGVLLSLIIIPLYVPILIFGAGAVNAAVDGYVIYGQLAILGAFFAGSLVLAPWASAGALRICLNN